MKTIKVLYVPLLAFMLMDIHVTPLQAQTAKQSSGMEMKNMKSQMEQMRADMEQMRIQMEQIQTLMKDNMTKMAAADAAMKSHMETEQAKMKSQMELQQAMIKQLQNITDHMQKMSNGMSMMPDAMEEHKKSGMMMEKDKGKMDDKKK